MRNAGLSTSAEISVGVHNAATSYYKIPNLDRGIMWSVTQGWPVRRWVVGGHAAAHAALAFFDSPFRRCRAVVLGECSAVVCTTIPPPP